MNRREFLEFFGRSTAGLSIALTLPNFLSCATAPSRSVEGLPFRPLLPSILDDLILSPGLRYEIFIKYGDVINSRNERFGSDNDFLGYIPITPDRGYLWVNHESFHPLFIHGEKKRLREHIDKERKAVGGSLIVIQKNGAKWMIDKENHLNRRWDATTEIPFEWSEPILGARKAIGTLANCSGGITPWGTFLSCEENYQQFYGDVDYNNGKRTVDRNLKKWFGWSHHYDLPPEHYGWVVEINPEKGSSKKLVALGRFAHEAATVVLSDDGRGVVYMGDDKDNECLYKFISDTPGSLDRGILYVANLVRGEWIPLDIKLNPKLKEHFKSQTDILMYARQAARIVGGTPLDRPEDIKRDPKSGAFICALTNNKKKGNLFGLLLKIEEDRNNPLSLKFKSSTLLAGGPETGFACPDNLAFDHKGNLWFTTDISDDSLGKESYKTFENNGLFYVPMSGPHSGQVFQVASAPRESELTGICFLPDSRTLLLSVQHPGLQTHDLANPTSRWPDGGKSTPSSAVVAISGPTLDILLQ